MTLTEKEIKDYIWNLNIRNYNKTEILGLLTDYYGLKNIQMIEIFRYGESYDIHMRYGGKEVFWDENCKMLDNNNVIKRRYKFRQQIYKDRQKLPPPPPQIQKDMLLNNLKNLMKKYKDEC